MENLSKSSWEKTHMSWQGSLFLPSVWNPLLCVPPRNCSGAFQGGSFRSSQCFICWWGQAKGQFLGCAQQLRDSRGELTGQEGRWHIASPRSAHSTPVHPPILSPTTATAALPVWEWGLYDQLWDLQRTYTSHFLRLLFSGANEWQISKAQQCLKKPQSLKETCFIEKCFIKIKISVPCTEFQWEVWAAGLRLHALPGFGCFCGHLNLICSPQTVPKLSRLCGTETSAEQKDIPAAPYHFAHWSLERGLMTGRKKPHKGDSG